MSTFQYDETPLPVGYRVRMNGKDTSYALGIYDGALYEEQYADEPEVAVLFESPDCARRWLEAATAALTPYIANGDTAARVPNPDGWDSPPPSPTPGGAA